MTRSFWNSMAALVAAIGLGGSSAMLVAQTPTPHVDRFVTVGVGNDRVRCKVIQSWSLPNGGLAYQVRSVESGDLITIVRDATVAGGRETPVRVYRWRDATTSPVGAPVPPTTAPSEDSSIAARKMPGDEPAASTARTPAKVAEPYVVPPTIIEEMQAREAAAAPTIVNGPKNAIQTVAGVNPEHVAMVREQIKNARQTPIGETTYIAPGMASETTIIAANQLPSQPAAPVVPETIVMLPQPRTSPETVTLPTLPPKDHALDNAPQMAMPRLNPAPAFVPPVQTIAAPALTPPSPPVELPPPSLPPELPVPRNVPAVAKLPPPMPLETTAAPRPTSDSLRESLPKMPVSRPPVLQEKREIIEVYNVPAEPTPVFEPRTVAAPLRAESWKVTSEPMASVEPAPRAIPSPRAIVGSPPEYTSYPPRSETATAPPPPASMQRSPQQVGPRVSTPVVGFDRTRTTFSPAAFAPTSTVSTAPMQPVDVKPIVRTASAKETIVEVTASGVPISELTPSPQKRTAANVNRPTTIMGMIGGIRENRSIATGVDRTRTATSVAVPSETIVLTEGKYPQADPTPVVRKKNPPTFNRTATMATMISANAAQPATQATPPRFVDAGFDRTRVSVAPGKLAATPTTRPVQETIVEVPDPTPVVVKKSLPETKGLFNLANSRGPNRSQELQAPTTASLIAETGGIDPQLAATEAAKTRVESKPGQPNAFTPAPQMQPRPPMTAGGITGTPISPPMPPAFMPPPAYAMKPQLPPVNLVQYSAPPKVAATGPANPAMDRAGTVVPSADVRTLAQLMQTAKESLQPSQRELAVMTMSNYDGRVHPQVVEFLKNLATTDPAPAVRAAAVNALARMHVAPQTVAGILETLRTDADVRVRQAADDATAAFGLGHR